MIGKGKNGQAKKVLLKLNGHIPEYDVDREFAVIAGTIEAQRQANLAMKRISNWELFRGLNLKRFLIGSWPKVLQQFVGLSIFSSYSSYFFQLAGLPDPFLVTIITNCASLAAVVFDVLLIDRLGRRFMTLVGFGGCCLGVLIIAIVGCFDYSSPQLGSVLVFAGTWANFFSSFQASTSYAYLNEMPEQRLKAKAVGWGLAYCNL